MIRTAPSQCAVVQCSEWLSTVDRASAVGGQVQCAAKCSVQFYIYGGQCREDKFCDDIKGIIHYKYNLISSLRS